MEGPLRTFTKKATDCKGLNYWERLSKFRLYSNQRCMERYKCIYIWKSLNGHTPSMGLEWSPIKNNRSGPVLKIPKLQGKLDSVKTMQRASLKFEGVWIFNSLPADLKTGKGTFNI